MTYIVGSTVNPPHFVFATLADLEEKVPDLKHRVEIVGIFQDGTRLLRPEEMPERLQMDKPYRNLRDIFVSDNGVIIVSRALHDLLEEMDPAIHQFSRIAIERLPSAGEHFLLNVHFKQDSIVDQLSDVRRHPSMPNSREVMYINFLPSDAAVDVTIDMSRLGKANLWRERRYPRRMFVSDALRDELKRRGLKFFKLLKAMDMRDGQLLNSPRRSRVAASHSRTLH